MFARLKARARSIWPANPSFAFERSDSQSEKRRRLIWLSSATTAQHENAMNHLLGAFGEKKIELISDRKRFANLRAASTLGEQRD